MGSHVHGQAGGAYGVSWGLTALYVAWDPTQYGMSWGVLWRAMGVACVHPSHLHSKCQHSNPH